MIPEMRFNSSLVFITLKIYLLQASPPPRFDLIPFITIKSSLPKDSPPLSAASPFDPALRRSPCGAVASAPVHLAPLDSPLRSHPIHHHQVFSPKRLPAPLRGLPASAFRSHPIHRINSLRPFAASAHLRFSPRQAAPAACASPHRSQSPRYAPACCHSTRPPGSAGPPSQIPP